ncbi:hypothetical protein SAMN02746065_1471 [Desulfocicer vacuolatum DSM 3385]|uniref:ResB-like family protein n=1 Tax=Desulfocicer vacuolatum DSM 3385 TaxID=1121400 RepID=A0A1W2ETX7_9BACT|nr:hypothetical protein [Desulfocicer vacuolatum]SMD13170.1 hypothetical protein SAMN02746065_1471 [Desulfocicer vacuolatum DSM 3385]
MIQKLSSIKLTFYSIICLGILLIMGVIFCYFPVHQTNIDQLNSNLIHHWLGKTVTTNPIVSIWVISVCLVSAILFINALLCSLSHLLPAALKHSSLKKWSFMLMHLLFLLVLTCHGLSLVSGHKTEDIQLYPGETHELSNGFSLLIEDIIFVDDTRLISMKTKKSRHLMTRKTFHPDKNYASVILMEKTKPLTSQRIMMLNPLVHGTMRLTLKRFLFETPEKSEDKMDGSNTGGRNQDMKAHKKNSRQTTGSSLLVIGEAGSKGDSPGAVTKKEKKIGVVFTISENRFTTLFFVAYGLLISTIICFITTKRFS